MAIDSNLDFVEETNAKFLDITNAWLNECREEQARADVYMVKLVPLLLEALSKDGFWGTEKAEDHRERPGGVALSSYAAAACLEDLDRTKVFIQGICEAVKDIQARFPGEKVKILYAGCGPYATLVLPLTAQFSPDEVEFTVFDINEYSLGNAEHLVHVLGLKEYFKDFSCCDAVTFSSDEKYHIVLAEMMDKALTAEPQAEVTPNLASLVMDGGIFLPEKISVDVELWKAFSDARGAIELGELIELDVNFDGDDFVEKSFDIPEDLSPEFRAVMLTTRVQVFGQNVLAGGDSKITIPLIVEYVGEEIAGRVLRMRHRLGGTKEEIECEVE